MNNLTKLPPPMPMEGIITRVTDGGVTIDLRGRLGRLEVPMRMLVSHQSPCPGQKVVFQMSLIEQLEEKCSWN